MRASRRRAEPENQAPEEPSPRGEEERRMDPIQLLKQDHRTVKGLFREFEKATRTADKQKLGQEIIEELPIHAAIEETLIYPLIREQGERPEKSVLNALEEHHAVKVI